MRSIHGNVTSVGLEYLEDMKACESRRKAQNQKAKFAFLLF